MSTIASILGRTPAVPIITIQDTAHAVPVARALVKGGIRVAEITLRTPAALDAIRAVAGEVPDLLIGVGTVLNGRDLDNAARAGATFAISPGLTPALLAAARSGPIPFLPGITTPSEIMMALEAGFDHLKFFPANVAGGTDALIAYAGPFPSARFCPTGGINAKNAAGYLELANVVCVGGSWITPAPVLARRDWTEVERLAREAATLGLRSRP